MTSPRDLTARAKALLERISPLPWWVHRPMKHYYIRSSDDRYVLESHSYGVHTEDDAEFIAAAPELVHDLLAAYAQQAEELARVREELDSALHCQRAYDAITRAIAEAVGSGAPHGPYWEDGVRWLQQRAEAAEAEVARLCAERDALKVGG